MEFAMNDRFVARHFKWYPSKSYTVHISSCKWKA
jgi:hypothetical protein